MRQSPFGFSPTGEAFNLSMEDVATSTAIALQADKLLFVCEVPGVPEDPNDPDSAIDTELALADAKRLIAKLPPATQPTDVGFYLKYCVKACESGVERSHILPFAVDGVMVNRQDFTKTANIWRVDNNRRGTNSNRIVLARRLPPA